MYLNIERREIISRKNLVELFPNSSLPLPPIDLLDLGFAFINEDPKPTGEVIEEGPIVSREGRYFKTWISRNFNEEEKQENLNSFKDGYLNLVDVKIKSALEKGVPFEFQEDVINHIQLRDGDRANLAGMRVIAMSRPEIPHSFRTFENNIFSLSSEQVISMTDAALFGYTGILQQGWELKDNISYALNEEEVETLWNARPLIFN